MLYQVRHSTAYDYAQDVSLSHHIARQTPRDLPRQRCYEHHLEASPRAAAQKAYDDHFGNRTEFLTIEGPHRRLEITSLNVVEVFPQNPAPDGQPPWEEVRDLFGPASVTPPIEPAEFVFGSPLIAPRADFRDYAAASFSPGRPVGEAAQDLAARIHHDFKFDDCATSVASSVSDFFKARRGVCQDFAQFMVACLRSVGLPARYVSGYLETLPPPGKPKLVGADASHAWCALWTGAAGWMDFDPTNNLVPSDRHITVAWGRDFSDVSPLRGTIMGGGDHTLSVAVDVTPMPFAILPKS